MKNNRLVNFCRNNRLARPNFSSHSSSNTPPNTPLFAASGTEVLQGVFDDQQGTVYIKNDGPGINMQDNAIDDIMAKRISGGRSFPPKRWSQWLSSMVPLLAHPSSPLSVCSYTMNNANHPVA